MNTHPLHFDEEYGKATEFGRCIVCSPLTVAIMVGMSVTDVSQKAIANLGWTRHPHDRRRCSPATRCTPSPRCSDKRESAVAARRGHRHRAHHGPNQDGIVVCTFERTILVAKRGHSVEDKIGY